MQILTSLEENADENQIWNHISFEPFSKYCSKLCSLRIKFFMDKIQPHFAK